MRLRERNIPALPPTIPQNALHSHSPTAYADSASPSDLITGTPAPTNLGYSVQLQTTSSLIRAYRDYTSSVWPSNTLIFNVQRGKITGVEWDLNCNTCSDTPKTCSKNTYNFSGSPAGYSSRNKSCYLPPSKCDKNNASCDINIFIAFSGTDKNGKVLNSAEARQSSFTRYDSSNLIPLPQK
ncbi:hypothetical protein TL16_g04182 [Triparma laevis f. inornata]|uniref:Uncharacterized protein n=2 Tax=Triparma laevis TaxID=1534972 RepID=A0A9W7C2V2_9STRA|nr:hypothetical protein TL16_g04182 [Triparma laevis f. inornata]GMI01760.1 hypothetical protein TrLO_g3122 [Triparma laevis f. longispina]